jgi:hypothetical protein
MIHHDLHTRLFQNRQQGWQMFAFNMWMHMPTGLGDLMK